MEEKEVRKNAQFHMTAAYMDLTEFLIVKE